MDNGTDDSWTIRNSRYKLIVNTSGSEEMYDLQNDPHETDNLFDGSVNSDETNAKLELEAELLKIRN
jgi:hypothetical protein